MDYACDHTCGYCGGCEPDDESEEVERDYAAWRFADDLAAKRAADVKAGGAGSEVTL